MIHKKSTYVIALEGIDGSGKSTIAEYLHSFFGLGTYLYRRTEKNSFFKHLLEKHLIKDNKSTQCMIYLLICWNNYLKYLKNRKNSKIVVMDRCFLTNICYYFSNALDSNVLYKIVKLIEPKIKPDIIFIFDEDVIIAKQRSNDEKDIAWMTEVSENYRQSLKSKQLSKYNLILIEKGLNLENKKKLILKYVHDNIGTI